MESYETAMTKERRKSRLAVVVASAGALALSFTSGTAGAVDGPDDNDKAKPCRPTITCTADIVTPGELQVEAGGAFAHGSAPVSTWTLPFLLHQGVASWLELQVGSNGLTFVTTQPHATFLDNVFVGPKFHIVDQQAILPSLSVSAQVSFPTFAEDGYTRNTDLFFVAFASKDLGPLHVDLNGGANLWRLNGKVLAQGFGSLVLSGQLPANFGVEAEGYIFSDAAPANNKDAGLRGVLTYSPRPWLVLDAGADLGFYFTTRVVTAFAGVTIIPVVFWRPAKSG